MKKKTLQDVQVKDEKVIVRVDLNVPITATGDVGDDNRIRAVLPTIEYLLDQGSAVILISHLGRPKGQPAEKFSLRPVARKLAEMLGCPVNFVEEAVGPKAQEATANLRSGEILLLENIRFYEAEEKNEPRFAAQLAALGTLFVNDAFGTAHRAHASTAGVAQYLPAVAGLLMEKELKILGQLLASPARPFVAIIGGAKISDKIGVIERLLRKTDRLLIGGGMANTFLTAQGYELQESLVEKDKLQVASDLLQKGQDKIVLPVDLVVAPDRSKGDQKKNVSLTEIPAGWAAYDVGQETVKLFKQEIKRAETIFWNGPVGLFEESGFDIGTLELAKKMGELAAVTIIGGGDTVAAIRKAGMTDRVTHVSTGGGASLKLLEGQDLPGVVALQDR